MFDPKYLDNFNNGTDQWYRHWLPGLVYTDGIHYLVENGAAWLIDAIASHQTSKKLVGPLRDFQLWELKVNLDKKSAVLTCKADSDQKPVITQRIEYTDFPMEYIKLYVNRGEQLCLMLPSEY